MSTSRPGGSLGVPGSQIPTAAFARQGISDMMAFTERLQAVEAF